MATEQGFAAIDQALWDYFGQLEHARDERGIVLVGIRIGVEAALKHPEWAAAYSQQSNGPPIDMLVEEMIEQCPIEASS